MASLVLQSEISAVITGLKPAEVAVLDAERQLRRILALDDKEDRRAPTTDQ
jgi:hypothetical protein